MKFLALGEITEILDSKRKPVSKKDRNENLEKLFNDNDSIN